MSQPPPIQGSQETTPLKPSQPPVRRIVFFLVTAVVLLCLTVGGLRWWQRHRLADETFAGALGRLKQTPAPPDYDINDAIRLIYLIDHSLTQDGTDLKQFLEAIERLDTTRVPKELLDAKLHLVEQLKEIYLTASSIEDRERMWEDHSKVFRSLLSMVDPVTGTFNATEAGKFLEQHRDHATKVADMKGNLRKLQVKINGATVEYLKVFNKYYRIWDQFCLVRDQAYLAADHQDWKRTYEAGKEALKQQPHDRESLLLTAWALIEQTRAAGTGSKPSQVPPLAQSLVAPESTRSVAANASFAEAELLLGQYVQEFPGQASPALVLRGIMEFQRGNLDQARLLWEQASAVYHNERQTSKASRVADTYALRSSLRKSASGIRITTLYRSMVNGAGYFSPELWISKTGGTNATLSGGGGDVSAQVMDHFTRRVAAISESTQVTLENPSRAGGVAEWLLKWAVGEEKAKQIVRTASLQPVHDYLLSDVDFCLKNPWPGTSCVSLNHDWTIRPVNENRNDNRLGFTLRSASGAALETGALVVCVQFTGMQANDYEVFMIPEVPRADSGGKSWSTAAIALKYRLFNRDMLPRDIVRIQGLYVTPTRILVLPQAQAQVQAEPVAEKKGQKK